MLREFQSKGYSLRGMADELTRRKIGTPRGGAWHPQLLVTFCYALQKVRKLVVKRTLQRLEGDGAGSVQ